MSSPLFAEVKRMLKRLDRYRTHIDSFFSFLPPLVTRGVVGFGFYLTGQGKIAHLDNLISQFKEWGIPYPQIQAPFVAHLEYLGAIALLLGLLTRPVAFLLASTMVVAIVKVDHEKLFQAFNPTSDSVPTDVTSFAYLILLLWLMLYGAGTLSLDRIIGFGWDRLHREPEN